MENIATVISPIISILSIVFCILTFTLNRKDKSSKEAAEEQKQYSKHDLIEWRLNKIDEQLEKILNKLDTYDKEVDEKIKVAIKHHIAEFHHKKGA